MSVSHEKTNAGNNVKVTKLDLDSKEAVDMLVKQVNELKKKLQLLSTMQMTIVEYLGDKSADFRAKAIANVMAHKVFRDDFTNFLNTTEGIPDEVKLQNMEINEKIDNLAKEFNIKLGQEEE